MAAAPTGPTETSLWANPAFRRVWTAESISIFGSFVTRMALPLVAILVLGADAFGVALVRSMDFIAGLAVGLVAGAWVDRLRRRPVLIWSDIGRAALLATIPLAWLLGWLSFGQLLIVALSTAVLTTFSYAASRAYLPTIVARPDLVRANSAVTASSSVSEFTGFGISGFLVQVLGGPLAIALDAVSFLVSAVLLGTIRVAEPPPPPKAERSSVREEIVVGLRLVASQPILRAITLSAMATSALWGVFGATWVLFAIEDLGLDAAAIGVIAAIGGIGSLGGALFAGRYTNRIGVGRLMVGSLLMGALGVLLIPLAPSGAPILAFAFLAGQQLIGDFGLTAFEISEVSLRQTVTDDRQLGRVNATVRVAMLLAALIATLGAGLLALQIGLRTTSFIAPLGAVAAALIIWFSPIRRLRTVGEAAS